MSDDEYKLSVLSGTALFAGISRETVMYVASDSGCTLRCYSNGETVYDTSSFDRALGILGSGEAEVYTSSGVGRVVLNRLKDGDVFGVAALFGSDDSYVTCVTARSRCEVVFIDCDLCERLIRASTEFSLNYITFLSDRIRFLNRRIASYTAPDALHKLAYYLSRTGDAPTPPLTKLAASLDLGRASLYRALDGLVEMGAVKREGRHITVCDREMLKKILEG